MSWTRLRQRDVVALAAIFAEPLSGLDKLGTRIYFTELFYKDVNETISEVHEALLRA